MQLPAPMVSAIGLDSDKVEALCNAAKEESQWRWEKFRLPTSSAQWVGPSTCGVVVGGVVVDPHICQGMLTVHLYEQHCSLAASMNSVRTIFSILVIQQLKCKLKRWCWWSCDDHNLPWKLCNVRWCVLRLLKPRQRVSRLNKHTNLLLLLNSNNLLEQCCACRLLQCGCCKGGGETLLLLTPDFLPPAFNHSHPCGGSAWHRTIWETCMSKKTDYKPKSLFFCTECKNLEREKTQQKKEWKLPDFLYLIF